METRFETLGRPLFLLTGKDKYSRSAEARRLFGVKEWEKQQRWTVTQTKAQIYAVDTSNP